MCSAIFFTSVCRRALDCCGVSSARAIAERSAYYGKNIILFLNILKIKYLTSASRRALVSSGVSSARAVAERSAYYGKNIIFFFL